MNNLVKLLEFGWMANNNKTVDTLKMELGVGLTIGTIILLLLAISVYNKKLKKNKNSNSKAVFIILIFAAIVMLVCDLVIQLVIFK